MSKSDLSLIEQKIRTNIDRYFSDDQRAQFVIAVSGGMDSMCLLYALNKLGISGWVAHVNYQKRGTASDKDADLVEQKAAKWGFQCHSIVADPAEAEGDNFQQWARDYRYRFFEQLMQKHDADGIALAHHKDDQVETILQKIFRGAGLASWSGMGILEENIFRPLLDVSKDEIQQYVQGNDIPYRTDESNLENNFARNFLRNEWLNKLSDFFPGWKENVLSIGQSAQHYEQAIGYIADQVRDGRGIDRDEFDSLESGLQKAVVLWLLKEQKPGLQISQDSLARIDELANLQVGKEITLTSEFSILCDRDYYVIDDKSETNFEPLTIEQCKVEENPYLFGEVAISLGRYQNPDFGQKLYLDAEKIEWPLTVRYWEEGDMLQPLGMDGHQKVADHLTNRKVSASRKNEALVVESFDKTICAIIFPPIKNQSTPGTISEQVKCDNETNNCLKITYRN
ncbi:tRNA(Ile)-lysidine synthase [Fodinibius salinus]|uniref:tRNA(Ile)-lysidine synthase n=1 Tax=Fodinibius salinus TaxID=860790 RepID=A0A5D3YFE5_9BACT|nr:tRNA lysidine(34) synthetase TilS [Fodinibius salinus]TYP91733.1 tRNA(Ile)-lysidine synthase [Fodinibius salinus]